MVELKIVKHTESWTIAWNKFVNEESINGTFLQSMDFLRYHPADRFNDHSLIIYKGNNQIVAVVPACELMENGFKRLVSHLGSTYGGIVFAKGFYDIKHVDSVFNVFEKYLKEEGFSEVLLKMTPRIFCIESTELLDYYLFKYRYHQYNELSLVVDLSQEKEVLMNNMSASRRRGYRQSLKFDLSLKKLESDAEVAKFYSILSDNLKKYETKPVHSYDELIDLWKNRLQKELSFYATYLHDPDKGEQMVSGIMAFCFDKRILHAQYIASSPEHLSVYPMNFLFVELINEAQKQGYDYFSFGISTEEKGKVLNQTLAQFKEGFGCGYTVNRTFYKRISTDKDETF